MVRRDLLVSFFRVSSQLLSEFLDFSDSAALPNKSTVKYIALMIDKSMSIV